MIVIDGDLNGHVDANVDGHGGCGYGERNADDERMVEFCHAVELLVTITCCREQRNKLCSCSEHS